MYQQFLEFYLDHFGFVDIIIDLVCVFGIILYVLVNNKNSLYPQFLNLLSVIFLFCLLVFWHYFWEMKVLLDWYNVSVIRFSSSLALAFLLGYIIITILRATLDSLLANLSQVNVYSLYEPPTSVSLSSIVASIMTLLLYCFFLLFSAALIIPKEFFTLVGAKHSFIVQLQYFVGDITYIIVHNPSTLVDYLKALVI